MSEIVADSRVRSGILMHEEGQCVFESKSGTQGQLVHPCVHWSNYFFKKSRMHAHKRVMPVSMVASEALEKLSRRVFWPVPSV